jgi:hypothetical protein
MTNILLILLSIKDNYLFIYHVHINFYLISIDLTILGVLILTFFIEVEPFIDCIIDVKFVSNKIYHILHGYPIDIINRGTLEDSKDLDYNY